jgi:hypothetical protein
MSAWMVAGLMAEKTKKTFRYAAELRKDGEVLAVGSLPIICVRRVPANR